MECEEVGRVEALQMVASQTFDSQLHSFFVEILQLFKQRVMDTSVWIAMVASIR